MKGWTSGTIRDFGRVVTGKTPPTAEAEYFNGSELFVSPKDLDFDSRYINHTETAITEKALAKFKNQVIPRNTVMFTSLSYSFGKVGIASRKCLTNQQINSIIVKSEHDFRFVFYLMRVYKPIIFSFNSGIDTPLVPKSVFEKVQVLYPDHETQTKIASILSAYDDLIENNKRRIAILEKMAEEIYREWFVRGRGCQTTNSIKVETLANVLEDIIDYRGITPAKLGGDWYEGDDGIIALSALNVKDGKLIRLDDAKRVSRGLYERWMRKRLKQWDILLTSEAPLGQLYLLSERTEYVLSQRVFALRAKAAVIAPIYLYHYFLYGPGKPDLEARATGSTVGGIRQALLRTIQVSLPPIEVLKQYELVANPVQALIVNLYDQNIKLERARDLLLPRLISGKLSVENLELPTNEKLTAVSSALPEQELAHA